nr:hypothetical protein [Variovorax boronicumulans]
MPSPELAALHHHADPMTDGIVAERIWAQAVAMGSACPMPTRWR